MSVTLWLHRVQCLVLRSVLSVFINLRSAECVCTYYGLRVCSQTNKLNYLQKSKYPLKFKSSQKPSTDSTIRSKEKHTEKVIIWVKLLMSEDRIIVKPLKSLSGRPIVEYYRHKDYCVDVRWRSWTAYPSSGFVPDVLRKQLARRWRKWQDAVLSRIDVPSWTK